MFLIVAVCLMLSVAFCVALGFFIETGRGN